MQRLSSAVSMIAKEGETLFKRCTQLSGRGVSSMCYSHCAWAMKPSTCASTSALSDAKGAMELLVGRVIQTERLPTFIL